MSTIDWLMLIAAGAGATFLFIVGLLIILAVRWFNRQCDEPMEQP